MTSQGSPRKIYGLILADTPLAKKQSSPTWTAKKNIMEMTNERGERNFVLNDSDVKKQRFHGDGKVRFGAYWLGSILVPLWALMVG